VKVLITGGGGFVGSHLAESVTVIALGVIVAVLMVARHHVRAAVFIGVAISVEAITYLGTTLVIDRHRPHVVRLDNLALLAQPLLVGGNVSFDLGHGYSSGCQTSQFSSQL
jgi:uncharacterized protein YbjT (DUF2867 family)